MHYVFFVLGGGALVAGSIRYSSGDWRMFACEALSIGWCLVGSVYRLKD